MSTATGDDARLVVVDPVVDRELIALAATQAGGVGVSMGSETFDMLRSASFNGTGNPSCSVILVGQIRAHF